MKNLPEDVIKILGNLNAQQLSTLHFANYFILSLSSLPEIEETKLIYIITTVLGNLRKPLKGEERLSFKADLMKLLNTNEKTFNTEEFKIQIEARGFNYENAYNIMHNFQAKKEYYLNIIDKKWNP